MPESALILLTTMPDQASAERLAESLVTQKLAACVNISASMTSIYRWQGKIERGTEHQLVIKTSAARYDALLREIQQQHPYELAEILAIPVSNGLPAYLEWIQSCTET